MLFAKNPRRIFGRCSLLIGTATTDPGNGRCCSTQPEDVCSKVQQARALILPTAAVGNTTIAAGGCGDDTIPHPGSNSIVRKKTCHRCIQPNARADAANIARFKAVATEGLQAYTAINTAHSVLLHTSNAASKTERASTRSKLQRRISRH